MKRDEILKTAGHLISKDRHDTYGDSATSHSRIAAFWSAYLGIELSAVDGADEGQQEQGRVSLAAS